jgi:hypothetical protein
MKNFMIKLLGGTPKAKTLHVWEYEPYAFEAGRVYVIEIDTTQISLGAVKDIHEYFNKHGVNVKIVPNRGKRVIQPIEVKRMSEVTNEL